MCLPGPVTGAGALARKVDLSPIVCALGALQPCGLEPQSIVASHSGRNRCISTWGSLRAPMHPYRGAHCPCTRT